MVRSPGTPAWRWAPCGSCTAMRGRGRCTHPAGREQSWCWRRVPQDAEAALAHLPLAAADLIVVEVIKLHPFSALEVLFADRPP